jgi:hypothetical protein
MAGAQAGGGTHAYVDICSIHYIHIDIRANVRSMARERDRGERERETAGDRADRPTRIMSFVYMAR